MEKVFINPVAKEILLKGNGKEGPVDLFTYDTEQRSTSNGQTLGMLYVIGNIQPGAIESPTPEDIDVGYVLNLVASLAKREYYSNRDLAPKDAFSGALKKINGVVEEFFKKKDTKINIGIFAIAGDQIHISKLGKFKILLARDGKNIDILNNIDLFDKESTQEKEFSNIISGKITEGDKILAFYPSRTTVAREKSLKDYLLGSTQNEFATQLATIKESKPDFACAAIHIDIKKTTEEALTPRIQPRELQEELPEDDELIEKQMIPTPVSLAVEATKSESYRGREKEEVQAKTISKLSPEPALPKIIPSEFAKGQRELAISKHLRRFKNMTLTPQIKMFAMGGIAVVILISIVSLKSFVFISSSAKELNKIVAQAQENLKEATAKKDQNDFIGARSLLVSSLSAIAQSESTNGSSKKTDQAKSDLIQLLDNMDNAINADLKPIAEIPADSGNASLLVSSGSNFYTYLTQGEAGAIAKITDGTIAGSTPISGLTPNSIFAGEAYISILDSSAKKITNLSISKATTSTKTFSSDDFVSSQMSQDNLYALTATGIFKMTDAALGHTDVTQWLASGTSLSTDASLLAVDGNIYTLSKNGILTTYYKGKKKSEVNTPVSPDTSGLLLTTNSATNLYLVSIETGRIYIFDKVSGAVSKTLKINSAQKIQSATLGSDGTIYILSENKIWKVQ